MIAGRRRPGDTGRVGPLALPCFVTESTSAPTDVVKIIDDPSGVAMTATFERVGDAVRLKTVTYSHPVELPSTLPHFPYDLAKSEAEKALLG